MKTKDKLAAIAKDKYFKNKSIASMWATGDGHFFHAHAKNYALNHASGKEGVEVFEITRADVDGKASKKKAEKVESPKEATTESVKPKVEEPKSTDDKPKTKPKGKGKQ